MHDPDTPSAASRQSKTVRYQNVGDVLNLLAAKWPKCFHLYEMRRQPLAIGIDRDIMAALDGAVSPAELYNALRCYTGGNKVYRNRLIVGAVRIGLDGQPAGVVTEKQAAFAAKISAQRLRRIAAKHAAKPIITTTPTPQQPKPALPQRLGLADLREAALQRHVKKEEGEARG